MLIQELLSLFSNYIKYYIVLAVHVALTFIGNVAHKSQEKEWFMNKSLAVWCTLYKHAGDGSVIICKPVLLLEVRSIELKWNHGF